MDFAKDMLTVKFSFARQKPGIQKISCVKNVKTMNYPKLGPLESQRAKNSVKRSAMKSWLLGVGFKHFKRHFITKIFQKKTVFSHLQYSSFNFYFVLQFECIPPISISKFQYNHLVVTSTCLPVPIGSCLCHLGSCPQLH